MLNDGGKLVRRVPDTLVVGDRDAAIAPAMLQPKLVGSGRREQLVMPLDGQPGSGENLREAFA
jgi:hypothetical protein